MATRGEVDWILINERRELWCYPSNINSLPYFLNLHSICLPPCTPTFLLELLFSPELERGDGQDPTFVGVRA